LLHKLAGKAGMQLFYSSISNLVRYRRLVSTANDIVEVTTKDDEFNQYFDEFRKNCFI
jgi:chromosome partitioning protein